MTRSRGFTLIEAATVLAIIAVLAALGIGISRAAGRNASLGSATYELVQRLRGLRYRATHENRDHVFVFADATSADGAGCSNFDERGCARWWILRAPAAWGIGEFDPANVAAGGAEYVDTGVMPRGVHLNSAAPFTAPAPFGGVVLADADLTTTCASRTCFAIRFGGDGVVSPVRVDPASAGAKSGYAFAFASTLASETRAADARAVLVSFPAGIVKVFTF